MKGKQFPNESFRDDTSSRLHNGGVTCHLKSEDKAQSLEATATPALPAGRAAQAEGPAFSWSCVAATCMGSWCSRPPCTHNRVPCGLLLHRLVRGVT